MKQFSSKSNKFECEGLKHPVIIKIDRWGIPHIYAQNDADLFFAQGFNAARDRLFQMDLWRKKGLGLLAKDFGAGYLAQDYASRLFLYKGDMNEEWAAYGQDAKAIITSFTNGINAYVSFCLNDKSLLPPEFIELNTLPALWNAEDCVVIRSHALTRNIISEVLRANVKDPQIDSLRKVLEPNITPHIDPDLGEVPLAVLQNYKLALANVTFSKERLNCTLQEAWSWAKVTELNEVMLDCASNNWVIAPQKSSTGRAIVANDPHRAHSLPGIRYLCHLKSPNINAIGHGEPFNAGIAFGHNAHLAYGLTIFYSDQEDLFFYDTHSSDASLYKYQNEWVKMSEREESFDIKGYPSQNITVKSTKHGVVLYEDFSTGRAYAIKTVWAMAGSAPYLHSLKTMQAKNLSEFQVAIRGWGTPSGNIIVADIEGQTAWLPSGFTPIRKNYDGLTPVSGAGHHDWKGMVAPMPQVINPEKGYFATANEYNVPPSFKTPIGYEWIDNARATRIHGVLEGLEKVSIDDCKALQTDNYSHVAKRLIACLPTQNPFTGWDFHTHAHSQDAHLFEIWLTKYLRPALLKKLLADEKIRALITPPDIEGVVRAIETGQHEDLLLETLNQAQQEPPQNWGALHHAYFEHPLAPIWGDKHDVGSFAMGGSASSPMMMGYRGDFRVMWGASVRLIMDVGAWDNSLCINTAGQSGDPRSPHYRDLAPLWAAGDYVQLSFSDEAVTRVTKNIIELKPILL